MGVGAFHSRLRGYNELSIFPKYNCLLLPPADSRTRGGFATFATIAVNEAEKSEAPSGEASALQHHRLSGL